MQLIKRSTRQQHPFHLVTPSPWPLLASSSMLAVMLNTVVYFHVGTNLVQVTLAFACLTFCVTRWFTDISNESTFEGNHTARVQSGMRQGMLLFMTSEIFFFFSFLWAFFHSSLMPSIFMGAVWPPHGIEVLNPWGLPFLNTLLLLSSGVSMTWAHSNMLAGRHADTSLALGITMVLGLVFTGLQVKEYIEAPFTMSSGIYGSIFFLATGFHGLHVLLGTVFLVVCFFRQIHFHFLTDNHLGFETAAWYWHFVDVVWLFLFVTIYWWGS